MEMATQYNLCRFVDRSLNERTSDKLRSNVLYLETPQARYELARFTNSDYEPKFRFAEITTPFYKDEAWFGRQEQLPLSTEESEQNFSRMIAEDIDWDGFLWGVDSVKVKTSNEKTVEIRPILNF